MVNSMESSRPIMAESVASKDGGSKRLSSGSAAPSVPASENTITTNGDARLQDIKDWSSGLERLSNKRLQQQRYEANQSKTDELSKLALGAKLDRALERRMMNQDAVMRPRARPVLTEKA